MANLIDIPDGSENWGQAMRDNLAALNTDVSTALVKANAAVNMVAARVRSVNGIFPDDSGNVVVPTGGTVDTTARSAAAAAQATADSKYTKPTTGIPAADIVGVVKSIDGAVPDAAGAVSVPRRVSAAVAAKMASGDAYEYEVVTVKAPSAQINSIVEKVYPNDYEVVWNPATTFAPGPAAEPRQFALDTGAYVLISGDAYESGKMTGIQIKNGVIYESRWGSADTAGPAGRGIETLGFRKDGTWKVYRQAAGDTAASMVADGVHTNYGFGPVVVENGALRDITTDPTWDYFVSSLSARTVMGRKANGDFVYILVKGKSGSFGVSGNTMGQIALSEGCVAAILLDGGGTTQGVVGGRTFHPSTDASGARFLRCGIAIHTPAINSLVTDWVTLPYLNGSASAISSNPMQATKTDGVVRLRGTVGITSAVANTWYTVGQLPDRLVPLTPESARFPMYTNQNGYAGDVSISNTGAILIKFPVVAATSWGQLDGITFPAVY